MKVQWKTTRKILDYFSSNLIKVLVFSSVDASLYFCNYAQVKLPHREIKVLEY
jgi:hypothetical protein